MKEKKNEIWIGHNGRGYFLDYIDNNRWDNKKRIPYHESIKNKRKFCDLLNELLVPGDFYGNGIELKFERYFNLKLPEEEKETIKKLINKFEKIYADKQKMFKRLNRIVIACEQK